MSEEKTEYITEALELLQGVTTLEISSPEKVIERRDGQLIEVERSAFVKIYTSFKRELKTLSGDELKVWLYLALSINRFSKAANPGLRKIAEDTGLAVNTVRGIVERLESSHLLDVERAEGKGNQYRPADYASVSKFDTVPQTVSNFEQTVSNSGGTVSTLRGEIAQLDELELTRKDSLSLSPQEKEQANRKMDAIIEQAREAQTRIEAGTGWRGRELLPPDYVFYGDLWHRLTGLEMYGAKAKAKIDTEWLKAFKECFENDISESAFCEAYVSETWEGRRAVGKPSMIVATAKAIQAANKKVESTTAQQGQGFYA